MKRVLIFVFVLSFIGVMLPGLGCAADAPKEEVPLPFWKESWPKVSGKIEMNYDINRDGILQPFETKILLRDVRDEVQQKNSYNVEDSMVVKAYDKNKDGIISKLELEFILVDLKE